MNTRHTAPSNAASLDLSDVAALEFDMTVAGASGSVIVSDIEFLG